MLIERCTKFIADAGIPVTVFCKKTGISPSTYYRWTSGDLKLSDKTEQRIKEYIEKFQY